MTSSGLLAHADEVIEKHANVAYWHIASFRCRAATGSLSE
jgi:hypothetical protein